MPQITFEGYGGVEIVADTFGEPEGPSVILLPATCQTKEMWHGAGQALGQAGRYAICVDLRGHGDSGRAADGRYDLDAYAQDVRLLLGQLSSRSALVGVGASGLAAILAVGESAFPLASALILVGVTAWVEPDVALRIKEAMAMRAGVFSDSAAALAAVEAAHPFEPRPTAPDRLLTAFERGPDGTYRWRCDERVLGGLDIPSMSSRIEEACGKISSPTSLIRGSLNESVPAKASQRLRQLIPESEISEIAGAGHYVVTDQEDAFNAVLLDFLERKAPRHAIEYTSGSDSQLLRNALACFATGVTVVTTLDNDTNPVGLTVNSFTSVSLDPPLILFSLAKNSANLEVFMQARGFAVNVLHIGQQPVSNRFARREGPRFDGVSWDQASSHGSPLLSEALASFDCRQYAVHEGGDHMLFIGEVEYARVEPHRDPLLFFRSKYRRLHFA